MNRPDPASIVRETFPNWRRDPYQKAAVDVLLRTLFAGETVSKRLDELENAIALLLEDAPTSLLYNAPRVQVSRLATSLERLAKDLRKLEPKLSDLEAWVDQFSTRHSTDLNLDAVGVTDGGLRPEDIGAQTESSARYVEPTF